MCVPVASSVPVPEHFSDLEGATLCCAAIRRCRQRRWMAARW